MQNWFDEIDKEDRAFLVFMGMCFMFLLGMATVAAIATYYGVMQ